IGTDLPVALDLTALRREDPDRDRLRQIFLALEFHSLVRDYAAPEAEAAPKRKADYGLVQTPAQVASLVERIRSLGRVSVDTETTGTDPMRADLVGISIAVQPGEGYYLPFAHIQAAAEAAAEAAPATVGGGRAREEE